MGSVCLEGKAQGSNRAPWDREQSAAAEPRRRRYSQKGAAAAGPAARRTWSRLARLRGMMEGVPRGCPLRLTFAVSDAASDCVGDEDKVSSLVHGAGSGLKLGGGQEAGPRETGCINR